MGPFLASAARRLTEPSVRFTDTGTDWRAVARRISATLAAPSAVSAPLAIDDADPLAYAAHAITALAAGHSILLCNPHWTAAERTAAETLRLLPAESGIRFASPPILIATGGSSGALRFATHSTATLSAAALALQSWLGGAPLNSVCLLPLHHVSGFQQLVRALATGGDLLLADWHALAGGHRPEPPSVTGGWILSLVPTQLQRLVEDPAACAWLRGFAAILLGGAPAGPALLARARAERLPLAIAYGASETAAVFAAQAPADFLAGRSGLLPLPHAAIRIVDPESGRPSAAGQLGRIEIDASSLFLGYWPDQRPPGPLLSDDLGFLDVDGRLHLAGRADAAINSGGEKVQPAEVEAALRATGAFSEVIVCAAPDPRWGECVAALFPAADAPDLGAVEQTLRAVLSPHKLPRRWLAVATWPRTAQGKTDRAALRRLAANP
ncbi:MAG: AMP-binding protein [Opitutaceae bacterium]